MSVPAEGNQLVNVVVLLGAAVVAVPLFKRLGLGSVLGIWRPAGDRPVRHRLFSDPKSILHVAELGVVMFLFIIGLEMQPSRLWKLRGEIFGLGVAQVPCGALLTGVGLLAGLSAPAAFMAAMGFVLSSTAIVMQIRPSATRPPVPRASASFPSCCSRTGHRAAAGIGRAAGARRHGRARRSLDPGRHRAGLRAGAAGGWPMAAQSAVPPAGRGRAREVMTAAALLVVLGAALLMELGGLSTAMGAFAGVLLSESTFRHQLEAEVEPFRGILLGLFFLGVGMSLDLSAVAREWPLILAAVLIFMAVKSIGVYAVARALRASHGEALTRAALLAQGGEFAFVLYAPAAVGIFDAHLAAVLTAVVIISMALTRCACWRCAGCCQAGAVHGRWTWRATGRLRAHHRFRAVRPDRHPGHAGARHQGVHPDTDTDAIRAAAKWGVKVYYGDGTRVDMLRTAGAGTAKLISASTIPRPSTMRSS